MNKKLFQRCVELSRALKPSKVTGRAFHTSFAIRKSKIVCVGWNNYQKSHKHKKFGTFDNWKNFADGYKASLHSEICLCIRLGEEDLYDYEIMNIRIGNNNQVALSAPCVNCRRVLSTLTPKRLFYSNDSESYEELELSVSQ